MAKASAIVEAIAAIHIPLLKLYL